MRGVRFGASRGDVVRLFEGESVAGLGEGELLDRFATRRDEAAFEALVGRLGPMVLVVCRRMLSDPHDVDDAFQATFLVLVRRAGSIRDRDLVATWLYGVALKVARRARIEAGRRKARERLAVVPEAVEGEAEVESGWLELRALIDEEIGRLPESHRRAVVLCDVEGLSREEAAVRLGWTLNMVRGRLERARGRLRGRLARRGVTPSGAWMALMVTPPVPPPSLLVATVRAALAFSVGRLGTGLASASAVAFSQGVLRMMMLSKWKVGMAVLLSAGFVAGGAGMLAAQGPGGKSGAEPSKAAAPAPVAAGVDQGADANKANVELQRKQLARIAALFDKKAVGLVPFLEQLKKVLEAELDAAGSDTERLSALQSYLNRLTELEGRAEAREEAERNASEDLKAIRVRLADAESRLAKVQVEVTLELYRAQTPAALLPRAEARPAGTFQPRSAADLARARVAAALDRYKAQLAFYLEGRITLDRLVDASRGLMQAESNVAGSKAARVAAARTHYDRLAEMLRREQAELEVGRASTADVAEAQTGLLDAEFTLAKELETPEVKPSGGDAKAESGSPAGAGPDDPTIASRKRLERAEDARILLAEASRMYPSEITAQDFLAASKVAMAADLDAAGSSVARQAAIQSQVDRLRRAQQVTDQLIQGNERKKSDARRIRLDLLEAELALAREKDGGSGSRSISDLDRRLSELERVIGKPGR